MKNHCIPDFNLHEIFNLQCEFFYASMICILAGMISIPADLLYGINYNEAWKMKSQFFILVFYYLHATFNLHREFLYAGTICIPMSIISIPACNILNNEKSIYNRRFILFVCNI